MAELGLGCVKTPGGFGIEAGMKTYRRFGGQKSGIF
jgi:hypothetical protein